MTSALKPKLPIRAKLLVAFSFLVLLICVFIFLYFPSRYREQAIRVLRQESESLSEFIAFSISPALDFRDKATAAESMEGAMSNPGVAWIVVTDIKGEVFAEAGTSEATEQPWKEQSFTNHLTSDNRFYFVRTGIKMNENVIGYLHTAFLLDNLNKEISGSRKLVAILSLILFAAGIVFVWWISGVLTRPLKRMVTDMERVSRGETGIRTQITTSDEAGALAGSFNNMLESLEGSRRALLERESRFRNLVETMTEGLAELDNELFVRFANPRFCEIFGVTLQEATGTSLATLAHLSEEQVLQFRKAIRETEITAQHFELDLSGFQGNDLSLYVSISRGENPGSGFIAIFTDITQMKQTENNLRFKNRELDTFVYKASHDLKAPLSSMAGLVSIARNEVKDDNAQNYLGLIERTVRKMDQVLLGLLEVTWMKQGAITLTQVPINLMVDSILESIMHTEGWNQIRMDNRLAPGMYFSSDEKLLQSILQNLLQNAFKYHRKSGDDRWVRLEGYVDSRGLTVIIRDNGPGIEEKAQEKIFDMFFRATNESTGSGLGLYIVRNACEKLGGNVIVKSTLTLGSEFTIKLPHPAEMSPPSDSV